MAYHAFLQVTHREKNKVIKALSKKEDTTHTEEKSLSVYYMSLIRSANFNVEVGIKDDGMTPTGEPKMGRYIVTVDMDCAYPEYLKALTEKWPLDVKLFWFGSTDTNEDTHNWMTVTLQNARVVGLSKSKMGGYQGEGEGVPDQVQLAFTYFYFHMRDHDSKLDVDWSFAKPGKKPTKTT